MIVKVLKSIFMLLIDIVFCILIWCCVGIMWHSTYAWKKLNFEYVDNVEFSGEQNGEINGTAPPAMNTADFDNFETFDTFEIIPIFGFLRCVMQMNGSISEAGLE